MTTTLSLKESIKRLEIIHREVSKPNADVAPEIKNELNRFVTSYYTYKTQQFVNRIRGKFDQRASNEAEVSPESCDPRTLAVLNDLQHSIEEGKSILKKHGFGNPKRASKEKVVQFKDQATSTSQMPSPKKFRLLDGTVINPPPDAITWGTPSSSSSMKEDKATKERAKEMAVRALTQIDGLVTDAGVLRTYLTTEKHRVSCSVQTELSTDCPTCIFRNIVKKKAKTAGTQYDEADCDFETSFNRAVEQLRANKTEIPETHESEVTGTVDSKESIHKLLDKRELTETIHDILRQYLPDLTIPKTTDIDPLQPTTSDNVDAVCHSSTVSPTPIASFVEPKSEETLLPQSENIREGRTDEDKGDSDVEILAVIDGTKRKVTPDPVQDNAEPGPVHVVQNVNELIRMLTNVKTETATLPTTPKPVTTTSSIDSTQVMTDGTESRPKTDATPSRDDLEKLITKAVKDATRASNLASSGTPGANSTNPPVMYIGIPIGPNNMPMMPPNCPTNPLTPNHNQQNMLPMVASSSRVPTSLPQSQANQFATAGTNQPISTVPNTSNMFMSASHSTNVMQQSSMPLMPGMSGFSASVNQVTVNAMQQNQQFHMSQFNQQQHCAANNMFPPFSGNMNPQMPQQQVPLPPASAQSSSKRKTSKSNRGIPYVRPQFTQASSIFPIPNNQYMATSNMQPPFPNGAPSTSMMASSSYQQGPQSSTQSFQASQYQNQQPQMRQPSGYPMNQQWQQSVPNIQAITENQRLMALQHAQYQQWHANNQHNQTGHTA